MVFGLQPVNDFHGGDIKMAKKEDKQPTFEEAMAKLDQIVAEIASGKVGLEDSLTMYEKGMELVNRCREILDNAEKRIEMLTARDGKLTAEPTDIGLDAGNPVQKPDS